MKEGKSVETPEQVLADLDNPQSSGASPIVPVIPPVVTPSMVIPPSVVTPSTAYAIPAIPGTPVDFKLPAPASINQSQAQIHNTAGMSPIDIINAHYITQAMANNGKPVLQNTQNTDKSKLPESFCFISGSDKKPSILDLTYQSFIHGYARMLIELRHSSELDSRLVFLKDFAHQLHLHTLKPGTGQRDMHMVNSLYSPHSTPVLNLFIFTIV